MKQKQVKTVLSAVLALVLILAAMPLSVSAADSKTVYMSVEAFSIGNGYVVEPTRIELTENKNTAQLLDELLKANNLTYNYSGTFEDGFYLKSINVPNTDKIPSCITEKIEDYIDEGSGTALGEMEYTALAGFLFTANNVPLSVGVSDYYPQDGDIIRVEFSLYYGADVGLAEAMEMDKWMGIYDFYPVADKDELTKLLADINSDKAVLDTNEKINAYNVAESAIETVNISQQELNKASYDLVNQINNVARGDVSGNGEADLNDVLTTQKYIAKITDLTLLQRAAADADGNGEINLQDVLTIQKILAKIL
ncbi:MAG: dockerin type I repeat-containing protein [Acutalibacteraceae bacterium]